MRLSASEKNCVLLPSPRGVDGADKLRVLGNLPGGLPEFSRTGPQDGAATALPRPSYGRTPHSVS